MLYGPPNEPGSSQAAREGKGVSNHLPSGAMATIGHSKAMTFATAIETSALAEPAERSHE